MNLDLYNESYDLFCQNIQKSSPRILEICCGPGNITRYITNKRPDFDVLALDVAPAMVELARTNVPNAEFKVMDCRELHKLPEKFDAALCGFCIPYLSSNDCEQLLSNVSDLLNAGGLFYLSTIKGDSRTSGYETGSTGDSTYVYYHPENDLTEILEKNLFEVIQVIHLPYMQSLHSIMIARKRFDK